MSGERTATVDRTCVASDVEASLAAIPIADRTLDDGSVLETVIARWRPPCMPVTGRVIAVNWYSVLDAAADSAYKAYAVPRVRAIGAVPLFVGRTTEIVERPLDQGPTEGISIGVPWVHSVITMPISPSIRSLFDGYVLPNADTIAASLALKRAAIGEDGMFSFQQCLAGCEELFAYGGPLPAIDSPHVLLLQLRGDRTRLPGQVDALARGLDDRAGAGVRLRYAGLTVADILDRSSDGSERYFNQKPLWSDVTLFIELAERDDATVLDDVPSFRELIESADTVVRIWADPDLAVVL